LRESDLPEASEGLCLDHASLQLAVELVGHSTLFPKWFVSVKLRLNIRHTYQSLQAEIFRLALGFRARLRFWQTAPGHCFSFDFAT
jgi:hypothetical protein